MTLNGVILVMRYFAELGSFQDPLPHYVKQNAFVVCEIKITYLV